MMTNKEILNYINKKLHNKTNLSDYLFSFALHLKNVYSLNRDKKTLNHYLKQSEKFQKYVFYAYDDIEIEDINKTHITNYRDFLKDDLKLNNKSINIYLNSLKYFFNFLVEKKIISHNYVLDVKYLKVDEKKLNIVKVSEIKLIFNEIRNKVPLIQYRDLSILKIILECGAAVLDVLNMKLDDVSLKENIIIIKNKKYPVSSNLSLDIKNYLLERENFNFFNSNYLFLNLRGRKYSERSLQMALNQYCSNLELNRNITARDFKQTFIFNMARVTTRNELIMITHQNHVNHYFDLIKKNPIYNIS